MSKTMNKTALTKKSQITLPQSIREFLDVSPGDQIRFEVKDGEVKIVPVHPTLEENFGKVKPYKKPEDFKEIRKEFERKVAEEVNKEY